MSSLTASLLPPPRHADGQVSAGWAAEIRMKKFQFHNERWLDMAADPSVQVDAYDPYDEEDRETPRGVQYYDGSLPPPPPLLPHDS